MSREGEGYVDPPACECVDACSPDCLAQGCRGWVADMNAEGYLVTFDDADCPRHVGGWRP